jgi:acyl-ACP thioesterase
MEAMPFNETFTMPAGGESDNPRRRLLAVLEEMMETAGHHAEILGVGVRDLHAKGLTWVLARLHVKIADVPEAGRTVHIATWPSGRHRLFAVREFQLRDEAGGEILRASSAWAMMNMETRRPVRLDPHLPVFSRHPGRMVEDDFAPLPPPYAQAPRASYQAEAGDIDLNDHVNNTVYLDWALRSAPESAGSWRPLSLEAAFLGEARLGDTVACFTEIGRTAALDPGSAEGGSALLQCLREVASDRELTRLRTYWQTGSNTKKTI